MNKLKEWLKWLLDVTGLEWLPVIFNDKWYTSQSRTNPQAMKSFEDHYQKLDLEQTKDLIQKLEKLETDEEKRQEKIEAKALSLVSFVGLSSAFVVSLVTLLSSSQFSEILRQRVVVVYTLVILSLFIIVVLAIKAIRVGKFSFMYPQITNLWEREGMSEIGYYRETARILLRSYFHNHGIINDKASFVAGAQDWFRNTIILLMLMTTFIVFTPNPTQSNLVPPITVTPIVAPTALQSVTPSETSTSTPSVTTAPTLMPTVTP